MIADLLLVTSRLHLRMPVASDASALHAIVADPRVALTTASIPHPYPEDGAASFIEHVRRAAGPERRNLAITLAGQDQLIGMIGFAGANDEAELAYMVSPTHWGRGYATEASARLIAYIFEETGFTMIVARAMTSIPASETVLRKVGFCRESVGDVELPIRGGVFRTSFWRARKS